MSIRVPQRPAQTPLHVALLCDHCEVMWRGPRDEPCWSCGAEGRPATTVIVVGG